jgi:hypothetical protein
MAMVLSARACRFENADATIAEVDVRSLAGDQARKARLFEPPSGVDSAGERDLDRSFRFSACDGRLGFGPCRAQQKLVSAVGSASGRTGTYVLDDRHSTFANLAEPRGPDDFAANLDDQVYEPYARAARLASSVRGVVPARRPRHSTRQTTAQLEAGEDDVGVADAHGLDAASALHVEDGHRVPTRRRETGVEALAVEVEAARSVPAAGWAGIADLVEPHAAVVRERRADAHTAGRSVARARRLDRLDVAVDVGDLQHAAVRPVNGPASAAPRLAHHRYSRSTQARQ